MAVWRGGCQLGVKSEDEVMAIASTGLSALHGDGA